jgi:hypothetical protein
MTLDRSTLGPDRTTERKGRGKVLWAAGGGDNQLNPDVNKFREPRRCYSLKLLTKDMRGRTR